MRRLRRDSNELEVVKALRAAGARVWRIKVSEPAGFPDLVVAWRKRLYAFEVKSPTGRLSEAQVLLHEAGLSHVVKTPAEALAAIGLEAA